MIARFAWDIDGARWQGPVPLCPVCDEPFVDDQGCVQIIARATSDDERLECAQCGESWPIEGETVNLAPAS